MIIILITVGLMVGTSHLLKISKNKPSILNYVLVLLGGIITFIFMPLIFTLYIELSSSGIIPTSVQLSSTISGIYFIGWAVIKLIKFKKNIINAPKPSQIKNKKESNRDNKLVNNFELNKLKVYKHIIIAGLIIFGFVFYWFQLRPTQIRKECFQKHLSSRPDLSYEHFLEEKNNSIKEKVESFGQKAYEMCLLGHGL